MALFHFTILFSIFLEKDYSNPEEEKFRMKIFMENKQRIAKHNSRYLMGHHSYQLEMNHYGDLLPHEFSGNINYKHVDFQTIFIKISKNIPNMQFSNLLIDTFWECKSTLKQMIIAVICTQF